MKTSAMMISAALFAVTGLAACNKPTEVVPIVVPGPPGAPGQPGEPGEPGKPGEGSNVIVVPPAMPASTPASATYSLTPPPRSTP